MNAPRHRLTKSRKGPWWIMIGPYDERVVAAIKAELPVRVRAWDAKLLAWKIADGHEDAAQAILDRLAAEGST